ncbi:MAG: phosphopantetheine-binding protein, partial [Pseudomonadota bacterium]
FGQRYFPHCAGIAAELRTSLELVVALDLSRLLPSDSPWHDELCGTSLGDVEFLMNVEDQFAIRIPDEEAQAIQTFADLVECVFRLTAGKHSA